MQQTSLQGLKVRPVDFAKVCNVSRQAVHLWIKSGKVTLPNDGFLDIQTAAAEYIKNTPANKVKASVFKVLSADDAALKNQITVLNSRVGELENELSTIKTEFSTRLEHTKQIIEAATLMFQTVETVAEEDGIEAALEFIEPLKTRSGLLYEMKGGDFGENSDLLKFDCSYLQAEQMPTVKNTSQPEFSDFEEQKIINYPDIEL